MNFESNAFRKMTSDAVYAYVEKQAVSGFELLRRGYDVAIGKIDNMEVDFIAAAAGERKYIQVTESMNSIRNRAEKSF